MPSSNSPTSAASSTQINTKASANTSNPMVHPHTAGVLLRRAPSCDSCISPPMTPATTVGDAQELRG
jgi:hypothetical protein